MENLFYWLNFFIGLIIWIISLKRIEFFRLRNYSLVGGKIYILGCKFSFFTVKHPHKFFLTFVSVSGKSELKITYFPFSSRVENVFLSKITTKDRFFPKTIFRHIFYIILSFLGFFVLRFVIYYFKIYYGNKNIFSVKLSFKKIPKRRNLSHFKKNEIT